jgi:GTP pyrophosphokinase
MKQEPKEDWLSFVKTGKAKQRIRQSLKKEKQLITGQGQMTLERKLKVLKLKSTHSNIQKLVNYFGLKNPDELFYKVGLGVIDNKKLREYARETAGLVNYFKRRIVKSSYAKQKPLSKEAKKDLMLVFGTDEHEMEYTLAKCCNPVPGDRVFGFVTTAEGLKVHRDDCPNAVLLQSRFANRTLKAKWVDKKGTFATINLLIEGMDRIGLVNDVTKVISSELSLNIKAISFAVDDGLFTGQVTIEVADKVALTDTITNIKQLEGISTVSRVGKFG